MCVCESGLGKTNASEWCENQDLDLPNTHGVWENQDKDTTNTCDVWEKGHHKLSRMPSMNHNVTKLYFLLVNLG